MIAEIQGIPQLRARIDAIKPNAKLLRTIAMSTAQNNKLLAPRKAANLGRPTHIGDVTATRAETIASADYAADVEQGTRAHEIRTKNLKPLRFLTDGGSARLSGTV